MQFTGEDASNAFTHRDNARRRSRQGRRVHWHKRQRWQNVISDFSGWRRCSRIHGIYRCKCRSKNENVPPPEKADAAKDPSQRNQTSTREVVGVDNLANLKFQSVRATSDGYSGNAANDLGGVDRNGVLGESSFDNNDSYNSAPLPTFPNREVSNQSTINSGLTSSSGNSRTDLLNLSDPAVFRALARSSTTGDGAAGAVGSVPGGSVEKQRRIHLLMDQCETVRFPFKRKLILANMNLTCWDIPVEHICSDRLGSTLYKLSLAGNHIVFIPKPLIVKLNGLRILDLSQCDLRKLPEQCDLTSLNKLNLSHNRI